MESRRPRRRSPPQDIAALGAPPPASDWLEIADLAPAGVGFVEPAAVPPPPGRSSPLAPPIGAIDGLIGATVFGWAYDPGFGRRRLKIAMYVNERLAAETVANGLRRELVGVGAHDGFSGFACSIPPKAFVAGATVRVFADGIELGNSPLSLGSKQIDGIFEPIKGVTASGWVRERVRAAPRALLDMIVDGKLVRSFTADRLREELKAHGADDGRFGFAEALPGSCLDGGDHEVEFRHRASGSIVAPGARRFRANYAGTLERLDQHGGGGWIACAEAPGMPIGLDIVVNGERVAIVAEQPRPDVRAAHGIAAFGFEFVIPATVSRHRELAVDILVAGTDNPAIPGRFAFTPVSRVIEQLEEFAASIGGRQDDRASAGAEPRYSPIRDAIVPSIIAALRAHDRRNAGIALTLPLDLSQFHAPAAAVADIVDVVIPVYAGYDETVACIESVIRSDNATRREIVVVDDCGPERKLREALQDYQRAGAITLVTNPTNLGFPAAANAGMSLHPDRDVILLNADTLVPRGWIDRLREAAYRSGNIGSVTPLSNRATICSYPEINRNNDLPSDIGWEALDQICAGVNHGASVEIPTAVGFCAYLRRAMLREVGLLNADRWKRGYAEENELCILAAARGWKHVMAPNLFVPHHGAVSFGNDGRKALIETNLGTLNRIYPDYIPRVMEFLRADPAAAARRAIDWARLKRLGDRFVLFVSHRYGGGTAVHVEDMAKRLAGQGRPALILEANADNRGVATIRNLALGTRSVYALPGEADALIRDLRAAGIWHIHFHQIMGGERWTALPGLIGCPYDVTIHDYSFFCPRIDLRDESGRHCGEPALEECERCIALNQPDPQLAHAFRDRGGMTEWLRLHGALLTGARRVFVPSRDVAARMERHIPGVRYEVRPHPEAARSVAIRRPASGAAARVAVIGAIGPHKGFDLLLACGRDALKRGLPLQYRLFGYAAEEAPLRRLGNMQLIGEYAREDLPRLIAENPCDVALFLSIWPETYCYALSDAYAAGFYPIALGFGALEERIKASKVGTLLPLASTPAQINDAILQEVARAERWPAAVQIGAEYDDILADYYRMRP